VIRVTHRVHLKPLFHNITIPSFLFVRRGMKNFLS